MDGYNLVGRIRPVYKGMWSADTAYTALETVTSADGHAAYIAVKDVPAGIQLSNEEYWGVLVDVRGLSGGGSENNSGGEPSVVFATLTQSGSTYSCDMTYEEILAVINAGRQVILKRQISNDAIVDYACIGLFGQTGNPSIVFHYHNQNSYSLAYIFQTGEVKHYNGTLVKTNLTINGHALSDNVELTAADVGALTDSDETWAEIDSRINAALGVIENGSY